MTLKKILLVDNDRFILEVLKDLLEDEGHEVMTAEDGLSALDVLEGFIPDVIFVDMVMPNIDGRRLCKILRKMEDLRETTLVSLSATTGEEFGGIGDLDVDVSLAKGPLEAMGRDVLQAVAHPRVAPSASAPPALAGRRDIPNRQVAVELLSGMKHLEVILEQMEEGIFELASDGRIVYANRGATSLKNLPEEDILGGRFVDLFAEDDQERVRGFLQDRDDQARRKTEEHPLTLNGHLVTLHIQPLPGTHGKCIVILNNVTEQRRLQIHLQQSQRMASIGTLAGGIAHEFNNLLTAIQANASLVLYGKEPGSPEYDRLKNIETHVHRGSELTRHLLAFARKGKHAPRPTNLNQLVKQTEELFARAQKGIVVHTRYQDHIYRVSVDPSQIEQVLLSLYINAHQAMPDGGEVFLETRNTELKTDVVHSYGIEPGRYVMISVRDTGIGMDRETRERIFEPFFTTRNVGEGVGLGLAAAYGIIRNHGGIMDVSSEQGKGSTFHIYLPAAEPADQGLSGVLS